VRAALAIRDWIAEEGKLEVRIGVNTGEALVNLAARPESGEGMAAGDIVNATARIETAAPANGILVGESTYRATASAIEYGDPTTIEAKGKEEPIAVWEAQEARARFGVDVAPEAATPLVGRTRELEVLKSALARACQQHSPELVALIGVPGIGKSRLVTELFASIDQDTELVYWRQGRSLPYGEGVSYWALGEMAKAQTGILDTDDAAEAEAKLTSALEDLVDEDVGWVHTHLRPLIGQASAADFESDRREEAFAAWRRAARLEALQPEEKALLQDAAVIGKVFWLGALAEEKERAELERRLHALERKEFVQRARVGRRLRGRPSSLSSICSSAMSRTGRSRGPSVPTSICACLSGSSRSAGPKTRPRWSRTTI
jgi:hypothetical protein